MTARSGSRRIAVVGGSLGGLTAALLLRDAGCDVHVFERSATALTGYGAGIVVHESTVRYFLERTSVTLDEISVASRFLRYLDRDGGVLHEEPCPYRFTSWSTIYGRLLAIFGEERYHRGEALVGLEQDADEVEARFESGRRELCDLLVCADGVQSTGRRLLFPAVEPRYAGYVGWRGVVPESRLSAPTRRAIRDAITYGILEHGHILCYPIPDGGDDPLMNFVWYRNVEPGQLDALMTDRHGEPRTLSLHPGDVQDRHVEELRAAAAPLAPPLAEVVVAAEQPFVQVIVDLEVPRMAAGRVCLIGDAAFAARPHAAAGTAKAAENAWMLAEGVVECDGDVATALERWEPCQLELGRRLVERAREIGERSQFLGTFEPGDPSLRFGLYGPGR